MNKLICLLLLMLLLAACKKDNPEAGTGVLTSCYVEYLFFRDDISFTDWQTMSYPPGSALSLSCGYVYSNDEVARVNGGFVPVPAGSNLVNYIFSSTTAYDSVYRNSNLVQVFTKYIDSEGHILLNPSSPLEFFTDSQGRLEKITTKKISVDKTDLFYTWSDHQVTESFSDGRVRRKFIFENENLTGVVKEQYDNHGNLFSKKEILFEDYDDHPNPLKNKFYLPGAFFRSFSQNNYQSITINQYGKITDTTFGLLSHSRYTMPISYLPNGYPDFGEYH
jgi:hypothetical protein